MEEEKMYRNPSDFPELKNYPAVQKFIRDHVDMLFSDFRLMLRAPFKWIEQELRDTGFNFSAYLLGIHILEGLSVIFSDDTLAELKRRNRRDLFVGFVKQNYPDEEGEGLNIPEQEKKAKLLYDARNPLVHSLGIALGGCKYIPCYVLKNSLSPEEISELERGKRPHHPTVVLQNNYCDIYVPALYWGIYQLLEKIFQVQHRMEELNKLLSSSSGN